MDCTFTLIQRKSTTCGSEEQETNIYAQQSTYRDSVLMDIYLTHNTQPHTKHTRTEHATQGTVMTYVTCAQYTMVSTELQHCACLCDTIWSRTGGRKEKALSSSYNATGFESVIATVCTAELFGALCRCCGAIAAPHMSTPQVDDTWM